MDKKALFLSCLAMLLFDIVMMVAIELGGTPEIKSLDIQTNLIVFGITDVLGVGLLYGAMTWD